MKPNESKAAEFDQRKVIQISVSVYQGMAVIALCDDGTMWWSDNSYCGKDATWLELAPIPQPKAEG